MTLPDERYRALRSLPDRLIKLATAPGPISKRKLRAEVRAMLRHYPTLLDIDNMTAKCSSLLSRQGDL